MPTELKVKTSKDLSAMEAVKVEKTLAWFVDTFTVNGIDNLRKEYEGGGMTKMMVDKIAKK